eukprot:c17810_g1_i3.p1 GENE.c17810_g1_i3~~c17810_g1_i3.p1  ORF type:complete len:227 (+),score=56.50 c17810_g1_i3:47-727(+)
MGARFSLEDVPSMEGKVVVVIGASSGIGLANARQMARKGAHVIMGCRSAEKALPLVEQIKRETSNDKVEFLEIDLLSLASVVSFAKAFIAKKLPLHVLLNNAAIVFAEFKVTADGYETTMQTNHISLFLATQLLLPILRESAPARIVFCTAEGHRLPRNRIPLTIEEINNKATFGSGFMRYCHTKLCNVYTMLELSRRLSNEAVYVNSDHPGVVNTGVCCLHPSLT